MSEQVYRSSEFANPSKLPKGKNVFYRCLECGKAISSVPPRSVGCECGNISIDLDMMRFSDVIEGHYEVVVVN